MNKPMVSHFSQQFILFLGYPLQEELCAKVGFIILVHFEIDQVTNWALKELQDTKASSR